MKMSHGKIAKTNLKWTIENVVIERVHQTRKKVRIDRHL